MPFIEILMYRLSIVYMRLYDSRITISYQNGQYLEPRKHTDPCFVKNIKPRVVEVTVSKPSTHQPSYFN